MTLPSPHLKVHAVDKNSLETISALLQDGLCPLSSGSFEKKTFSILVNRFIWEDFHRDNIAYRVHCGLVFQGVKSIRQKGCDNDRILNLLMIKLEENNGQKVLRLIFSNHAEIELIVDDWICNVRDFHEPWPTVVVPDHGILGAA